jgi:DUF4097 and DUF4098 domain-containing protein YvlB
MKQINTRWVMIALFAVIVSFGIGKLIDTRCEGGCLNTSIHEELAKNGNKLDFLGGGFHFSDDSIEGKFDSDESDGATDAVAQLPSLDGVERIEVQSVNTDWSVQPASSEVQLRLQGARSSMWSVKKDGKTLMIQVKAGGADSADLTLPDSYKGKLLIKTVSGELNLGEVRSLSALQLDSASGDLSIHTWPSETLEVNTVSGDVRIAAPVSIPQAKDITLHSVSADFSLEINSPFHAIHVQTVSGSLRMAANKNLSFAYEMHSVSGDFLGLPSGGTVKEGFGTKEMSGKAGSDTAATANLHFESVSGDFSLDQGPEMGSR